jgi:hypothetical protein
MRLLNPQVDYSQLSFVRPGESYRQALFQIVPGEGADESALSLTLPDLGKDTPARYAAALYVGDVIAARPSDAAQARIVEVKLQATGGTRKSIDVALIERDGTAWTASVAAGPSWTTVRIPVGEFRVARSIHIPSPFPGLWNYWREASVLRGGAGDRLQGDHIERLQLTVYPNSGDHAGDNARGAQVESIRLQR